MVEAERRVFADRSEYIADPEFFDVPVDVLTSKAYADEALRCCKLSGRFEELWERRVQRRAA